MRINETTEESPEESWLEDNWAAREVFGGDFRDFGVFM